MFYSSFLNKLSLFVQLSTQIQTHSGCFVKTLAWIWQISQILCVNSWKFYPNPKIFYTCVTCATCDKFHVRLISVSDKNSLLYYSLLKIWSTRALSPSRDPSPTRSPLEHLSYQGSGHQEVIITIKQTHKQGHRQTQTNRVSFISRIWSARGYIRTSFKPRKKQTRKQLNTNRQK